jgi:hypothetical protein
VPVRAFQSAEDRRAFESLLQTHKLM